MEKMRKMTGTRPSPLRGVVPLALTALLLSQAAFAQEVNEDYIVNHLGPAAENMQWAGVDGSGDSSPAIIEISQRWGIEPAYWISVEEARWLVRSEREDRVRERLASSLSSSENYPSRVTLARFGVMRITLTCAQAQEKARAAQRLADTLSRVSQLNAVGTGLVGALSQGAARFYAPMGFATLVTGMAATWANQMANAYRNAACLTGDHLWRFRPNVMRTSLFQDRSHVPSSLPGPCGSASAPLPIGPTTRLRGLASPFFCRSAFGHSRSL
jgi:hypothetical protein